MNGREQENTENFITQTVNAYIKNREKVWSEQTKVQRIWNWIFAIITVSSIVVCGVGIKFFTQQGEVWNEHIILETRLALERSDREIAKAKRDSVMADAYMKEMKAWKKMPYYRKEK
jgi:hypothetical protein